MLKFGTKNVLFGCFWARIQKQNCYILNQHSQISLIAKFHEIMKIPKFRTENILFGYSRPKMSYLCILRLEFEKIIVIFEMSIFELALLQSLVQE